MTIWYAQNNSANINSANMWNDQPAGAGNFLTWENRAAGDVFSANGKTAIVINVDPGVGGVSGSVTLSTAANGGTAGGMFSVATAGNLTINAHISAEASWAIQTSGSTGTLTINGNVSGGSSDYSYGIYHVSTGNLIVNGNVSGGSGMYSFGVYNYSTGSVTINGNATGGSKSNAYAILNNSTGNVTLSPTTCLIFGLSATPYAGKAPAWNPTTGYIKFYTGDSFGQSANTIFSKKKLLINPGSNGGYGS
ncbi:MAG: hypothetical protein LLG40_13280 [Deltaproteobacteria bacterium]|nr:hypothetical protein [Deltaproteobacteria bacterium]